MLGDYLTRPGAYCRKATVYSETRRIIAVERGLRTGVPDASVVDVTPHVCVSKPPI